jgi:hypothetical protein
LEKDKQACRLRGKHDCEPQAAMKSPVGSRKQKTPENAAL